MTASLKDANPGTGFWRRQKSALHLWPALPKLACHNIVVLRFFSVTFLLLWRLAGHMAQVAVSPQRPIRSCDVGALAERLGGAFPKLGQILSTRADLVGDELRWSLSRLQDNVTPVPAGVAFRLVAQAGLEERLRVFKPSPVASGTVAQVHEATLCDSVSVALKLLRPDVRQKLLADCRIIQFFGRIIARMPSMASIPVQEALRDAGDVLLRQTDFRNEANNHLRLQDILRPDREIRGVKKELMPHVHVPALHSRLSTDSVLAMEFVGGMKKISDATLPAEAVQAALVQGVRALYLMIFVDGFIHCDMHPGNVLVAPDGRLVILDAGFMVELSEATRRSFAEFFLAIAFRDGATAAKIVRETALRLPPGLDVAAFDEDIAALIQRVGGLKARDFQVAGFVGELFAIMRRHGIYGTSQFTLIILSLLVYEGVTKQRHPDLDFQQEAIPFVLAAMNGGKHGR